jgi:hypothetical protein
VEELYEDDERMGRTDFEMEQVHHDTGRAIANASLTEVGGAGSSSKSSDNNNENSDSLHGSKEGGAGHTSQLTTEFAGTTLQANEAQLAEGQASASKRPALENT